MSRQARGRADAAAVRRFLAIGVPDPQRDALAAATVHLRRDGAKLRPTAPDSWHVTLAYLGAVDVAAAEAAVAVLQGCLAEVAPRPAPRLSVAGAGRFGDRVLLAELAEDPPGALGGVVASLQTRLRQAGFALPGQRFRAHLTLARARGGVRVDVDDVRLLALPAVDWQPDGVGLWASAPPSTPGPYVVETEVGWPTTA